MVDQRLLESWRITESHLEKAISHLPDDAVLECEDGSLDRCRYRMAKLAIPEKN